MKIEPRPARAPKWSLSNQHLNEQGDPGRRSPQGASPTKVPGPEAPRKGPKTVNFGVHFCSPFEAIFRAEMSSKNGPRMAPKIVNFVVYVRMFFSHGFGALRVPPGSLLGPLEAFLGGLEKEKMQTVLHENHFFEIALFRFLKLLMALLRSSRPLLGPICSQNGPKMSPKSAPKNYQKVFQKMTPKMTKK